MKRIVLWALVLFSIAAVAQQPQKPITLADVKSIYVPIEKPKSASSAEWPAEFAIFQKELMGQLIVWDGKGKAQHPRGDCKNGFESVLPKVRVVCKFEEADAVLIGDYGSAGSHGHVTGDVTTDTIGGQHLENGRVTMHSTHAGTVSIYQRGTDRELWVASKNDYNAWTEGLLNAQGSAGTVEVVRKLVKQLKKDWPKTAASR